jgi:hypothetical protein
MEFSQSVLSVITSDTPSPIPPTLTWGEDDNKENDSNETRNETNDSDEGNDAIQDEINEQRELNNNEQHAEGQNEQLNLTLTSSQNSPTEAPMEPDREATWKEQSKNTDDEKENARFWKDLEAYEETSSDGKEEESDLSEENEEYKENPFYYPNQHQEQQRSSSHEPKFTSNEAKGDDAKESSSDPDPAIANKKETKRAMRYKIQNEALQRLFRPTPPKHATARDDREEQESSSTESSPPVVLMHEWRRARKKTLQEHNEE